MVSMIAPDSTITWSPYFTVGATGMPGLIALIAAIEPARSPRLNSSLYGRPSSSISQMMRSDLRPSR
jgi:hypothetical protein